MGIASIATFFFSYLWLTRRDQRHPDGSLVYDTDTLTSYVALAICCVLLVILMLFVRKSPKRMNFFTR